MRRHFWDVPHSVTDYVADMSAIALEMFNVITHPNAIFSYVLLQFRVLLDFRLTKLNNSI